jgi:ornithine carbamoyltransferase
MSRAQPFADLLDVDAAFLSGLVELALQIKTKPKDYFGLLEGRLLYGLYQKTSTRTHLSFAKAMASLGGVYVWQSWRDSNFAISDVENEGRYVSTTADVLLARLIDHEDIVRLKRAISIPLINGCCNKFHPTQAIADILTIREALGGFENVRVVYVGVLNNVLNSLALALPQLGAHLVAVTPVVNPGAHDEVVLEKARATGNFTLLLDPTIEQLRSEIGRADAVYTDTWIDMEVIHDPNERDEVERRKRLMMPFQINRENYGSSKALVMHCMPLHVGYEIEKAMVDHPRSVIFRQAENRTHGQSAILLQLLAGR